jgi:solute carrier family 25 carnitine/acylcarnitine transporter 20/29
MSADFWAGYVSGAAGIIIGNPLDLIKTRLQAGKTAHHVEATSTAVPAPQGFRGSFENAGTLVRGAQQSLNSVNPNDTA